MSKNDYILIIICIKISCFDIIGFYKIRDNLNRMVVIFDVIGSWYLDYIIIICDEQVVEFVFINIIGRNFLWIQCFKMIIDNDVLFKSNLRLSNVVYQYEYESEYFSFYQWVIVDKIVRVSQ